ncbi:MAG: 16S rRNA (cytidine(1402)-2'-O)-methyltransferase [Bacteroidota bacterium]
MRITLIPTPIGNLEDITLRAIRLLQEADLIAAEDTRTSGKLLKHHGIATAMTSLHMHNEHKKVTPLLTRVKAEDLQLAVITDAGTPGISDPGFLLVRAAVAADIPVEVLPGATAFVPALVASGLPCDRFVFEGFLPVKKGRMTRLKRLADEARTMVFYESPHRILKTLGEFVSYFGSERKVAVSREISKLHETHLRGSLEEVIQQIESGTHKGEMVIVLAGKA